MLRFPECSLSDSAAWSVRGALSVALFVAVVGCKDGSRVTTPTAPNAPAVNVSGNWSAVLSGLDRADANGQLAVTFDHRPVDAERGLVLGTWSLTSPDRSSTRTGTVSGVVRGNVGMIELVPVPRWHCPRSLDELLAGVLSLNVALAPDRLAGTVSAHTCGAKFDSALELRR